MDMKVTALVLSMPYFGVIMFIQSFQFSRLQCPYQ